MIQFAFDYKQLRTEDGLHAPLQANVGEETDILRMLAQVDAKLGRMSAAHGGAGATSSPCKARRQNLAQVIDKRRHRARHMR